MFPLHCRTVAVGDGDRAEETLAVAVGRGFDDEIAREGADFSLSVFFSNKSIDVQKEIDKMKKCPKCNSSDVTKTEHHYEKKS